jgi:hypothetical protein
MVHGVTASLPVQHEITHLVTAGGLIALGRQWVWLLVGRVAVPWMNGRVIALFGVGSKRSSGPIANPAAVIAAWLSRLGWQPPANHTQVGPGGMDASRSPGRDLPCGGRSA